MLQENYTTHRTVPCVPSKKHILLFIIIVLFVCGCSRASTPLESDIEQVCLNKIDSIYKTDKNYKILSDNELTMFHYFIYDNNGYLMDEGYHDQRGSFDIYQSGELLVLDYGCGGNTWHERYYDTSKGNVSRFFERPVKHSNKIVAYFDVKDVNGEITLVVQNIFDTDVFYKEIIRDFSDFVIKKEARAEFIDDDTKLKLHYWVNPNNEEVVEIFDIGKRQGDG